MATMLKIEIVYCQEEQQIIEQLTILPGTTIWQAITKSQLYQQHNALPQAVVAFGVFGKIQPKDYVLANHDRVELYRELVQDPKELRRRKLQQS